MSATLSSHILDTHLGKPAADVAVTLHRIRDNGAATLLAHGTTNSDGRVTPDAWQFDTAIDSTERQLDTGRYTVPFDTQSYFDAQQLTLCAINGCIKLPSVWCDTAIAIGCTMR